MKKLLVLVILACLTMFVFVSCDSNPPSSANTSQSSNQSDSVDSGDSTVKMTVIEIYDKDDNLSGFWIIKQKLTSDGKYITLSETRSSSDGTIISDNYYELNPDDSYSKFYSLSYKEGKLNYKAIYEYNYNSEGQNTKIINYAYTYDSDGTTVLYLWRTETDNKYLNGEIIKETQSTYNDNNELTSKSISEYEYEHDTDGKVIKKTEFRSSYNSNNELISEYIQEYEYEYNSDGKTTKETEYGYESDGITLRYKVVTDSSYNQAGNILTTSLSTFQGSSTVVTQEFLAVYEYDESGSIQKRISQTNTSYLYSSDYSSLLETQTQTTIIIIDGKEVLFFSSIDGSEPIYTEKMVFDIES